MQTPSCVFPTIEGKTVPFPSWSLAPAAAPSRKSMLTNPLLSSFRELTASWPLLTPTTMIWPRHLSGSSTPRSLLWGHTVFSAEALPSACRVQSQLFFLLHWECLHPVQATWELRQDGHGGTQSPLLSLPEHTITTPPNYWACTIVHCDVISPHIPSCENT